MGLGMEQPIPIVVGGRPAHAATQRFEFLRPGQQDFKETLLYRASARNTIVAINQRLTSAGSAAGWESAGLR
jgi:hypothetical protein